MSEEKRCPQCGAVLAADAPQGLCPACLLKRGFATSTGGGESNNQGARTEYVPPPPAELARYFPELEILEMVGRGGMGVVYKARQKRLDRLVALKILPPNVSRAAAFSERFTREAKALARLTHPNIVVVYDFGQADGLFYFLMEFVDGMNLRQLLNTGRLSPKEALAIVPQICEALQFAHDKGIVHRDIKPENILIDKTGVVKIADFGLAKLVGLEAKDLTITSARDVIGTPLYMAPEQVEHPQDVDHRADIYSLGVVFYQMLTGELPIGRFAPPSRKVQIDVRLDEVVLRALEKEPEQRYQHASDVKTQVETILTTPASRGGRDSDRTRSLVSIIGQTAVVGVALLFACLVVLLGMSSDSIDSRTWSWFRLGFEILAAAGLLGFVFVVYRAIRAKTPEARQAVRSVVPWILVIVLGILFGFWSPHLLSIKSNYIGQTWFPEGDSIEITSVERTKDRMVVRGHYNLASHDTALLALYITSTNKAPEDAKQRIQISKGQGDFELIHPHLVPGQPHVSMYADGHPFAALYFGTKAEALEESAARWIINAPVVSTDAKEDVGQTMASSRPVVVEGRGWGGFNVGATREELIKALGQPDSGSDNRWMKWEQAHVHCLVDDARGAFELRFDEGFPGLTTAGIGIGSPLKDALAAYGEPSLQKNVGSAKELLWSSKGILIWFHEDRAAQIIVFQKTEQHAAAMPQGQVLAESDGARLATTDFHIGQTWFPKSDSIEITSVERTRDQMTVKGHYNLVSHDSALLALYVTTTNNAVAPEDAKQRLQISKGAGDFELIHPHLIPGLPHVSMYADGHPFAALYFGTKAEALEESQASWITNAPVVSTNIEEDLGQTVASSRPVVIETQPVSGATDVEPGISEIRVRFNKRMADGSWSWCTVWENSTPEFIGQPYYDADGRTCVAKAKLEPGRTYGFWINSQKFQNFTDRDGRPAVPYLLTFQTRPN
jgi:serine/threonine protein kinase